MTVRRRYIQKTKKQGGVRRVTKSKIQKRRTMHKKGGVHTTRRMKRWGGMPKRERGPGGHAGPVEDEMGDDEEDTVGADVSAKKQATEQTEVHEATMAPTVDEAAIGVAVEEIKGASANELTPIGVSRETLIVIIQVALCSTNELIDIIPDVCKRIMITSSLLHITGLTGENYTDSIIRILLSYGVFYGGIVVREAGEAYDTAVASLRTFITNLSSSSIGVLLERPIRNGMFFYLLFLNFGKYSAEEAFKQTVRELKSIGEITGDITQLLNDSTIMPIVNELETLKTRFDRYRGRAEQIAGIVYRVATSSIQTTEAVASAATRAAEQPFVLPASGVISQARTFVFGSVKKIQDKIISFINGVKSSARSILSALGTHDPSSLTRTQLETTDIRNHADFIHSEDEVKRIYQEYRDAVTLLLAVLPDKITKIPDEDNMKRLIRLYGKVRFLSRKFLNARKSLRDLEESQGFAERSSQLSQWSAQIAEEGIVAQIYDLTEQYKNLKDPELKDTEYSKLYELSDRSEIEAAGKETVQTMEQTATCAIDAVVSSEPSTSTELVRVSEVRNSIVTTEILSNIRAVTLRPYLLDIIYSIHSIIRGDPIGRRIVNQTTMDNTLQTQLVVYDPEFAERQKAAEETAAASAEAMDEETQKEGR